MHVTPTAVKLNLKIILQGNSCIHLLHELKPLILTISLAVDLGINLIDIDDSLPHTASHDDLLKYMTDWSFIIIIIIISAHLLTWYIQ